MNLQLVLIISIMYLYDNSSLGLDPNSRAVIIETINSLRSEGKTVILTTHYIDEADELADRIIVISKGY